MENVRKSDATLGENTKDNNNDFNMVVNKKFEEFKTYNQRTHRKSEAYYSNGNSWHSKGLQGPVRIGYFYCWDASAACIKPEV